MASPENEEDDIKLMRDMRNGSTTAFSAIYEKYFDRLNRFAYHMVMSDASLDIVQDVFAALWSRRMLLMPDIPVGRLLFTSVKNRSLDYLKHHGVEDKNRLKLMEAVIFTGESAYDREASLMLDSMESFMKNLPERQKEIMNLRIKGYSYHEISSLLGLSEKTVKTHIVRAYSFLREKLSAIVKSSPDFLIVVISLLKGLL